MSLDVTVSNPPPDEPVFNTFRRKPLRPFYSLREVQIGLGLLALLGGVVAWVAWRGVHPDPHLFGVSDALLANKGQKLAMYKRPVQVWVEPGSTRSGNTGAGLRLEPFPPAVISSGWQMTGPPQMFDESNLYNKVDGREAFYKSYGFKKLYCLSLTTAAAPVSSLDIELYDLGSVQNALGALSGEISSPDTTVVKRTGNALWYATRNGGFLAQGRYYARLIGSDDQDAIRQKVDQLRDALVAALPGDTLPWAYELFVGGFGISPARIQYHAENAFSFGFANDFYAAALPNTETEIFLSRRDSPADATKLAGKMAEGFAGYGQRVAGDGPALFKNEYIGSIEGVEAKGLYVLGVRLAKSPEEARQWLTKLQAQLEKSQNVPEH